MKTSRVIRISCIIAVTILAATTIYTSSDTCEQQLMKMRQYTIIKFKWFNPRIVFTESLVPFPSKPGRIVPIFPTKQTDAVQQYQHFDDSGDVPEMERHVFPHHEFNDKHCKPEPWQFQSYPTCNEIHAMDLDTSVTGAKAWILSKKGFWRYAWEYLDMVTHHPEKYHRNMSMDEYHHEDSVVFKTLKLDHGYEEAFFENNRVDALAMEKLTSSPYIINMFGFCGMAVIQEYAGKGFVQYVDRQDPLEKLRLAKVVAQGLSEVHNAGLVHNDLNFANVAFTRHNKIPVLNDFNIAVIQLRHNQTGKKCTFTHHFPNPQWRSPEEQMADEHDGPALTEKIDVYALGNILYRFALGTEPWRNGTQPRLSPEERYNVYLKKLNGTLPEFIFRDDWKNRGHPATQALITIVKDCFAANPQTRPSAQQLVMKIQKEINAISSKLKTIAKNVTVSHGK